MLQLIWSTITDLSLNQRRKTVHVISTDTLVENPIVSTWVENSPQVMARNAEQTEMLVVVVSRLLRPKLEDSFWVNLIGCGYPAPRHKFHWCTERLRIAPSNAFITNPAVKRP